MTSMLEGRRRREERREGVADGEAGGYDGDSVECVGVWVRGGGRSYLSRDGMTAGCWGGGKTRAAAIERFCFFVLE
jgi:hypothetical protein